MLGEEHEKINGDGVALAWRRRAGQLAEWSWPLVNRTDVFGGYTAPERRGQPYRRKDGAEARVPATVTRPTNPADRGRVLLNKEVIARHYRGERPEHVIGLHTTGPDNTSRWGALDIDWHGPDSTAPELNLAAAIGWYGRLIRRGFTPLLTDSNGKGGYHLLIPFSAPAPTPRVFAFVRSLVADHAAYGLPQPPEVFPKQARIEPGRFGNWMRLPGRHHTHDHWSRTWDGHRWLDGEEAVDFVLALRGTSPDRIPAEQPPAAPAGEPAWSASPRPAWSAPARSWSGALAARIATYMRRLPNLGEGQGRDDVAYQSACWLVRDMQLPDAVALDYLRTWDAGNSPPKGEEALRKVVTNAHRYGRSPYGCGLRPVRSAGRGHGPSFHFTFRI
jgi:hypothetical protein